MPGKNKLSVSLSWTSHPARLRPKTTTLLIIFITGLAVGIYFSFDSLFLSLFSIVVLVASLSSFFFPIRYTLDEKGATIKGVFTKRTKPWTYFHSYYYDRHGLQLSTFSYPSRLDPFRGFSIQFGKNNRDDVIEFVGRHLKKAEARR
ncbi:MAG: hypothetical protein ACUVWP_04745 [bacterium]